MQALINVILYVSIFSALPAVWLGRKQRGLLWLYVLASLTCDVVPLILSDAFSIETRVPGNLFAILELLLVGLYFGQSFWNRPLRRAVFVTTILLTTVLSVSTWQVIEADTEWRNQAQAVSQTFLLLLCIGGLLAVIRNAEEQKIERSQLFLVSASMLLYLAYSMLLMLFTDQFIEAPQALRMKLWAVHNLLNILKNLAIGYSFFLAQKQMRRSLGDAQK